MRILRLILFCQQQKGLRMASLYGQATGQLCPDVFKFPILVYSKATHVERYCKTRQRPGLGFMSKQEPGC